jgi:Transposase DDE domain group 1
MDDDTLLPFSLPSVDRKKITAAFDGGRLSSDGGVVLLAGADRQLGLAETLAGVIPDHRNPLCITHALVDILRARIFAIACGYPDADDLDDLRRDPAFKLACGRLPESGEDLASQPTISRLENAPDLRTLLRLGYAMVDLWCRSYRSPPKSVTLDIDDTLDVVHGEQQLSLFNAHYDERCFLPIHVYDADSGHCVAVLLRPGKTPAGSEIRGHLRRLVRRIRRHWPNTRITIRGDSHYGRAEVMDWCEANDVGFILGLAGNPVLAARVETFADAVRTQRAIGQLDVVRGYAETRYAAKSWSRTRRVAARIEATRRGLDIRYVVTNIQGGSAEWLYDWLYCARGQMENLIKLHKTQLASDRTSCRSPLANQMRLILHTAAYWLVHAVRAAIPRTHALARAEFATIRLRLLKVAARISESATRVRLAFAAACPDAAMFRGLVDALWSRPP